MIANIPGNVAWWSKSRPSAQTTAHHGASCLVEGEARQEKGAVTDRPFSISICAVAMLIFATRSTWTWIIAANVRIIGEGIFALRTTGRDLTRRQGAGDQPHGTGIDIIAIILSGKRIDMRGQKVRQFGKVRLRRFRLDLELIGGDRLGHILADGLQHALEQTKCFLCLYSLIGVF